MINLILCGGVGSRLWPLSRTLLPKQFVRLFDGRSLFQETVRRNQRMSSETLVVSNLEQYFLAVDQLEEIHKTNNRFLLEPIGRNTAPAIALACLCVEEDDLIFVTTSDHLIKDQSAYEAAVEEAKQLALKGNLVTFGIKPSYPEVGFGYIEASGNDVLSFKEKPTYDVAKSYMEADNYFWNSGMFCFKAGAFLSELEQHAPEIYQACKIALSAEELHDQKEIRVQMDAMAAIPEDSIDYAVMEKSDKVKVVPCDIGWSDLGSFDSLYEEVKESGQSNAILSRADEEPLDPILLDSKDNLLLTRNRQIALIDVEDLLVIDTSDALLISKKGSSQKVKEVVKRVKTINPELAEVHRVAHRPWGTYEVLLDTSQYKIKRIIVKPDKKLSLQKHFHRNEHWVVVSGTATVTVGDERYLVRPNESTYIQMGEVHRLENEGKIDLVMIEVQVGEYTGEDDIIRIEDIYGR